MANSKSMTSPPPIRAVAVDGNGFMTREMADFIRNLWNQVQQQEGVIADLNGRIAALETQGGA